MVDSWEEKEALAPKEPPLTASVLADALGCFWNAALSEAHDRQDSVVFGVVSCMAQGFAAIQTRLTEHATDRN